VLRRRHVSGDVAPSDGPARRTEVCLSRPHVFVDELHFPVVACDVTKEIFRKAADQLSERRIEYLRTEAGLPSFWSRRSRP
jgi:hypothetical protein